MSEGVVLRGAALNDPEIVALDRLLPRVIGTFDPSARQRIMAGVALDEADPSPGYALLSRRLLRCARAPRGKPPADAGMRLVMKDRVVTFNDVERLMDYVGRSAGPCDVTAALERLHAELAAPDLAVDLPHEDMLDLCLTVLNRYSDAGDPVPGDPASARDPYFASDEAFADVRDEGEADTGHSDAWRGPGMRASIRIGELWDTAFRDLVNGDDGPPLSELAGTMQVAVVTGFRGDPKVICQATGAKQAGSTHQPVLDLVLVDEDGLLKSKAHNTPSKVDALVRSLLDDGNFVIYVASGPSLPPFVEANAVRRIALGDCHDLLVSVVDSMDAEGFVLRRSDGRDATAWVRETATAIPFVRANAAKAWLRRAYDTGSLDATMEDILARLSGARFATPVPVRPGPQSLAEVHGLGDVTRHRIQRLAGRLRSPEGGRMGLLLAGPSGTGKTLLAGLLARESGRHFVHGSLSEWQSAGYLNDFLAAMRATFDEARRNAPSILFIDEADSIGHRGSTGNRNDDYWNMVVNCMLECLQGLGDRGDVAVVAATNHPDLIDPAIRREGRLGETIEIPLPDRRGRADILASMLDATTLGGLDAQDIADRLGPCSPAAIDGLVREARSLASEASENLGPAHVEAALRATVGPDLTPRVLRAVAIGLASEAIMASVVYGADVRVVSISAMPGLADRGRVTLEHADGNRPLDTAGDRLRALHVALAPACGRALVAAGNGTPAADAMECFTHLVAHENEAALAHALAIVDSGAVAALAGPDAPQRGELARRTMGKAWTQVGAVLRRNWDEIAGLVDEIVTRRRVDGEAFERIVGGESPPTLH